MSGTKLKRANTRIMKFIDFYRDRISEQEKCGRLVKFNRIEHNGKIHDTNLQKKTVENVEFTSKKRKLCE